jgi:pimeloyl-[acyl-carrier protein] methyl ester esterase
MMQSKPNIIFLPGWGFHASIFESIAKQLAGYPVQLCDLPTTTHSNHTDIHAIAQSINPYLPNNTIFIAWSLGGLLATSLCYQFPDKYKKLVLIAHTPKFIAAPDWHGCDTSTTQQFTANANASLPQLLRTFSAAACNPVTTVDAHWVLDESYLEDLLVYSAILFQTDLRYVLKQLPQPIMHILGEQDNILPVKISEQLAKHYPNHHINQIKNAGHAPFLSHEKEISKLLLAFLSD